MELNIFTVHSPIYWVLTGRLSWHRDSCSFCDVSAFSCSLMEQFSFKKKNTFIYPLRVNLFQSRLGQDCTPLQCYKIKIELPQNTSNKILCQSQNNTKTRSSLWIAVTLFSYSSLINNLIDNHVVQTKEFVLQVLWMKLVFC